MHCIGERTAEGVGGAHDVRQRRAVLQPQHRGAVPPLGRGRGRRLAPQVAGRLEYAVGADEALPAGAVTQPHPRLVFLRAQSSPGGERCFDRGVLTVDCNT